MSTQITRLDLIRHGEPVGGRRFRGDAVDDPLSDTGWQQLESRLARLDEQGMADWDVIATSPMVRCRSFAAEVAERRGLELVVDPDLREIGFGRACVTPRSRSATPSNTTPFSPTRSTAGRRAARPWPTSSSG